MIHGCLTATFFQGGYWIVSKIYGEGHAEEHKGMQFFWSMLLLGWVGAICALVFMLANSNTELKAIGDYLGLAAVVLFVIALPVIVIALKRNREKKPQVFIDSPKMNQQPAKKLSGLNDISSVPMTQELTKTANDQLDEKKTKGREEPRIQFCRKCGAKLLGSETYCRHCGTLFQTDSIPAENYKVGIEMKSVSESFLRSEAEGALQKTTPEQVIKTVSEEKKEPTNYDKALLEKKEMPPILRRAFMFLEDGEFGRADEYFERVLDQEPECFEAYLGKAMCENKCRKIQDLVDMNSKIQDSKMIKWAKQFADEDKRLVLEDAFPQINRSGE